MCRFVCELALKASLTSSISEFLSDFRSQTFVSIKFPIMGGKCEYHGNGCEEHKGHHIIVTLISLLSGTWPISNYDENEDVTDCIYSDYHHSPLIQFQPGRSEEEGKKSRRQRRVNIIITTMIP